MKWDTSSTVLKKPFAIRGGFTNGLGLVRVFMVHVYRSAAITTERSSRHGRMYASQWSISVQYCYDAEKRSVQISGNFRRIRLIIAKNNFNNQEDSYESGISGGNAHM